MSAERLDASPALLALMRSKPVTDAQTVRGWETGSIQSKPANPFPTGTGFRSGASPFLSIGPYGAGRRYLSENQRATRYERRRMRGGDGRLPHSIRGHYTEGHRAVLSVIGAEFARSGRCELSIERIAVLAGVSIRTVQYAIRRAKLLGHLAIVERPQRRRKSLTNIIRIAVSEWIAWLKPKRAQVTGCKGLHTTEIKEVRTSGKVSEQGTERAFEREQAAGAAPPGQPGRFWQARGVNHA